MGADVTFATAKDLAANGFGTMNVDIFVPELEPEPDHAISVAMVGGGEQQRISESVLVSIMVRDPDFETCLQTSRDIWKYLDLEEGDNSGDVQGVPVASYTATGPAIPAGRDGGSNGGRWLSVQTFAVLMKSGYDYIATD
jgi:hypothetical protein